jgi:hypothetical protein
MSTASATSNSSGALDVLQRIRAARPAAVVGERCEMCGETIPADGPEILARPYGHHHVVDVRGRRILCACRACSLLFPPDVTGLAYRGVPDGTRSLPALTISSADWDALQVPVGLVFFFVNSALDRPVGCYPGPAGATESELGLDAWSGLVAAAPAIRDMAPDVEALLVRCPPGPDSRPTHCYLVPIDVCYALVGRLRQVWRGFDGGSDARAVLDELFDQLAAQSPTVSEHGA